MSKDRIFSIMLIGAFVGLAGFVVVVLQSQQSRRPVHEGAPNVAAASAASAAQAWTSAWTYKEETDALTDKKTFVATAAPSEGRGMLAVRCRAPRRLEYLAGFSEFLSSKDDVKVTFRVDASPAVTGNWGVSTEGTTVFAPLRFVADYPRQLIGASRLIIEAEDFRGTAHRVTFNVIGAHEPIAKVLSACNRSVAGLAKETPGLRAELAAEYETWGPKTIVRAKRILASLGLFQGPDDAVASREFLLAGQALIESYEKNCPKYGTAIGGSSPEAINCFMFNRGHPLSLHTVLYERAKGALKREAGEARSVD
jgi:hypothetical protein